MNSSHLKRFRLQQETLEYYDYIELHFHGVHNSRLNNHFDFKNRSPMELHYLEKSSLMVFLASGHESIRRRNDLVVYHFSLSNEYVCERFNFGFIKNIFTAQEISSEEFIYISFLCREGLKWFLRSVVIDIRSSPFQTFDVLNDRISKNSIDEINSSAPRFCATNKRQFSILSDETLSIFGISIVPTLTGSKQIVEKVKVVLTHVFKHSFSLSMKVFESEVQNSLKMIGHHPNATNQKWSPHKKMYFSRHNDLFELSLTLDGRRERGKKTKKKKGKNIIIEEEEEEEEERGLILELEEEEEVEGEISRTHEEKKIRKKLKSLHRKRRVFGENKFGNLSQYRSLRYRFVCIDPSSSSTQENNDEQYVGWNTWNGPPSDPVLFIGFFHFSKDNYKKYPYGSFSVKNHQNSSFAVIKSNKKIHFVNISNTSDNTNGQRKLELQKNIEIDEFEYGDSILIRSDINRLFCPLEKEVKQGERELEYAYFGGFGHDSKKVKKATIGINVVHVLDESVSLTRTQFIDFHLEETRFVNFKTFFMRTRHDDDRFGIYSNNRTPTSSSQAEMDYRIVSREIYSGLEDQEMSLERFCFLYKSGTFSSWRIVCDVQNLGCDESERVGFVCFPDDDEYELSSVEVSKFMNVCGENFVVPKSFVFLWTFSGYWKKGRKNKRKKEKRKKRKLKVKKKE